jgi:uncharacterized protein (DUF1501 family)
MLPFLGPAPRVRRRELLRAGLGGFAALSLADVLRRRAAAAESAASGAEAPPSPPPTAVILVWLRGGCSHLDTFDPKPEAPLEYRGPFATIDTVVPGMQVTELLPRIAQVADRFTLLRSMAHDGGGHPAGSLQVLSGDRDAADKPAPVHPDWMSVASFVRRHHAGALPNYVAVNPVDRYDSFVIAGPAYLGASFGPFQVVGDPARPDFRVPNLDAGGDEAVRRLTDRAALAARLDRLERRIDSSGALAAADRFEQQALALVTSPDARRAFDLGLETEATRDRYGRNAWGQQCLMARRLVEAGVSVVTTEFDGPLCGRVANWDDHAVNHHVFDALAHRAPPFDQAVSALVEDIYARGLDERVLVVVTGEFGRTPRISHVASSGGGVASAPAGTVQPGRDHWPRANTMLFAGGGIRTGQVIGRTDRVGEDPLDRRVGPDDFLATIYRHLGIDRARSGVVDLQGRPVILAPRGEPIAELAG